MMMQFMGINLDGAMGASEFQLRQINTLQKAAADNIANVNTPGYRPKRYNFSAFLTGGNSEEAGLMETPLSSRMGQSMLNDLLYTQGEDGKVDLQQEFMDMQRNYIYFQMASRHMTTVINNIKTASQAGR
jgi:flagellar basal-body rod protein FlgB